jgi:hypothetical protein
MTNPELRDLFASHALPGLLDRSLRNMSDVSVRPDAYENVAKAAYAVADAMLKVGQSVQAQPGQRPTVK